MVKPTSRVKLNSSASDQEPSRLFKFSEALKRLKDIDSNEATRLLNRVKRKLPHLSEDELFNMTVGEVVDKINEAWSKRASAKRFKRQIDKRIAVLKAQGYDVYVGDAYPEG